MIPFTQHLMPDGRRKSITIDRPEEIESLAIALIGAGCSFEIEMLQTGEVSMTCEHTVDGETETLAIEVVPNGPAVPTAVDKMVREAHSELARVSP
jgi:hypothetical protein